MFHKASSIEEEAEENVILTESECSHVKNPVSINNLDSLQDYFQRVSK